MPTRPPVLLHGHRLLQQIRRRAGGIVHAHCTARDSGKTAGLHSEGVRTPQRVDRRPTACPRCRTVTVLAVGQDTRTAEMPKQLASVRLVQTLLRLAPVMTMSRGRAWRFRAARWTVAVLLVTMGTPVLGQTAEAQTGADPRRPGVPSADSATPDFLFGRPDGWVGVRAGWHIMRGQSDWYDFVSDQLTIDDDAFDTADLSADVGVTISSRVDAVAGVEFTRASVPSEYPTPRGQQPTAHQPRNRASHGERHRKREDRATEPGPGSGPVGVGAKRPGALRGRRGRRLALCSRPVGRLRGF